MFNRIINHINLRKSQLMMVFFTIYIYILNTLKNIEISGGNRFFGFTKFYKERNSKLKIGRSNVFRSSQFSNLIGINRPCVLSTLRPESNLNIGNCCGFSGTVINCFHQISIGNNVMVGANSLIMDGDWHLDDVRAGASNAVMIEDNVWIGEGVKVLKGVRIGKNSVIGAGSIVTKDIPENVFAAGNPCRVLKNLDGK